MSSKIRVFVSSTMKDLANERDAVVRRIADFNFEPVNAEGWLPNGTRSWDRIKQELLSSHLCVLILGDRYGWIPQTGPGATAQLSVTAMEAAEARAAAIPVLPFLKELAYGDDGDSDDAKRRDEFRAEVASWDGGMFVGTFRLASDLSDAIGEALVGVLSESYLNGEVQRRSQKALPPPAAATFGPVGPVAIEATLAEAVRGRRAVLLAGAGMSLSAGYPSAHALIEVLAANIVQRRDEPSSAALRGSFQEVAESFALAYGEAVLQHVILKALSAPQGVAPTRAHRLSVRLFRVIMTTNFDSLFERACEEAGLSYKVIARDEDIPSSTDGTLIVKVDGSMADPSSLVLTAEHAAASRSTRPRLWQLIDDLLRDQAFVVVGHSLRDANAKEIVRRLPPDASAYVVAPDICSFDERRFRARGLVSVKGDAETFLEALASAASLVV